MSSHLISVIVPCYNQAQYLDECLQSVLDQTYQNWECIIVNDGSPDHTEETALRWTAKDARFKYVKKENGGLSSARNAGIEVARGEWILPLDCDDKIGKQYMKLAEKEFENGYTVIYCEAEYFGDQIGAIPLKSYSYSAILHKNMIFCTSFFKKESWENVCGYDVKLHDGLEDWDFWLSILTPETRVMRLDEVLFYYRIKQVSMLSSICHSKEKKIRDYLCEKHAHKYIRHFGNFVELLNYNKKLRNEIAYYKKSKFHRFAHMLQKLYYGLIND